MRPGEEHGREYFFLGEQEFRRWIGEDRFLEWAEYGGNLYGTPKAAVEENLAEGRDVLLEIELEGAWQVYEHRADALMIFIMPPSLKELERRLRGRQTETEEAIRIRMAAAAREMAEVEADMGPDGRHRFDYAILNDSVERARDELARVILKARDEDEQANH
jgi:guanylate kinase